VNLVVSRNIKMKNCFRSLFSCCSAQPSGKEAVPRLFEEDKKESKGTDLESILLNRKNEPENTSTPRNVKVPLPVEDKFKEKLKP
jgi:hypothetical protein